MERIIAMGVILDSDGNPVSGRSILLQGFEFEEWSNIAEIPEGDFEVEVPLRPPTDRGEKAGMMPLRLVDRSGQTPMVISDGPMLVLEQELMLADFGRIRLLKEPYQRKGRKVEGELVIGIPHDLQDGGSEDSLAEIRKLRAELADSQASLVTVKGELDLRTEQVNTQKVQLASATTELNLSKERLAGATTELATVRTELSTATSELLQLTDTLGTPTKVVDVIAGLGTQLSATNVVLAKQPTPFRLAEVKLDLRGRLGNEGDTIVMDGTGDGSGLSANLVVDAPSSAVLTQGVPSILGLTESAAIRVLRSVGFRMDTATQRLAAGEGVPGQAVTQHPAAGQQAEFGTSVLAVFGVRSEGDD